MTLNERAIRIRVIDEILNYLHEELDNLYDVSNSEYNKLFDMVMSDGKQHWT